MFLLRVDFIHPILWSIITLLHVVLARSPPDTICHPPLFPSHHRHFEQDCSLLAFHAALDPGSLSDLSLWTELPGRGFQHSHWWRTYGLCILSFMAESPLSSETWQTVIDDFKAIQRECVHQRGAGGSRFRGANHEQPGAGSVLVVIRPNEVLLQEQQIVQVSGSKTSSVSKESVRRRILPRGQALDVSSMATRCKSVAREYTEACSRPTWYL
jgi:hypothetical protein